MIMEMDNVVRLHKFIDKLRLKAKELTNDLGNPFFRMLQILEYLRRY
jgi:hypothetical protein